MSLDYCLKWTYAYLLTYYEGSVMRDVYSFTFEQVISSYEFLQVSILLLLVLPVHLTAFSALTLLVGRQEGHPAL